MSYEEPTSTAPTPRSIALAARAASRSLQSLTSSQRSSILTAFSTALSTHSSSILAANQTDLDRADAHDNTPSALSSSSKARLVLNQKKLSTLCTGIDQIASLSPDPLGKVLEETELTQGLVSERVSCSIGVLLVIFESRPDVLPQLVSLAIKSGNGILLKGGKESQATLELLHSLACNAITTASNGIVRGDHLVALLPDRSAVSALLSLSDCIDLVIPRGSSSMVKQIQEATKIPVMGHSEGICHVYIDKGINGEVEKAVKIIIDAKTEYPAACNAMETLLIHQQLTTTPTPSSYSPPSSSSSSASLYPNLKLGSDIGSTFIRSLHSSGVFTYGGPLASSHYGLPLAASLSHEYSDLSCTIEIVPSLSSAISHIHEWGSGHTEVIVTEEREEAERFLREVDSACVFWNASSRFADGFRLGLGAEVGISTGRLHARGPVGVEGLTTYKWVVRSGGKGSGDRDGEVSDRKGKGHTVTQYNEGEWKYTHKKLQ